MIDHNPNQNPNQKEDTDWQLDALLDSLLRSYSAAEPRPGFETRLRAVVGEQATRPRRPGWLMLAASAAALAIFAWMMIANPHKTKTKVEGPNVAHDSSPAPAASGERIVIHLTAPLKSRRSHEGSANIRSDKANRIVLQMVAATQGSGSVVFEHEKLYLTPEKSPETATAAAPEEETQAPEAPAVSIKSIGLASIESNAPIEIKDLAPPKSSNEKGSP
jgi:hypothetical protein